MIHVTFICTGNICRSAMAEGYLKMKLEEANLDSQILVESAGINAISGELSTDFANKAIGEYGVNIKGHKATHTRDANIQKAEYIIVMTKAHKDELIRRYTNIEGKIHLLKEYKTTTNYMDLDDPWGLDLNVYKECAKEITTSIDEFLNVLKEEVKDK